MIETTQTVWKASTTTATILTLERPSGPAAAAPTLHCHAYKLTVGEALELADALASASPNADGYIRVSTPSGRFYFHRLVYEVATGCPIPPRWHVHHVDGNVSHNCPINLQALPSAVHSFISAQKATLLSRCAFCGRPFRTRDLPARAGVQLYCSVPCARRHHHAWPPPDPTSDLDIFARPSLITVDTLTPTRTYAQPSFSFF